MSTLSRRPLGFIAAASLGALVASLLAARPVGAQTVVGASLYAAGGPVTASFVGEDAGYYSELFLFRPQQSPLLLRTTDAPGTNAQVGSFGAGEELVFGIDVWTNPDKRNRVGTWYTGPGGQNPDGVPHAAVTFLGGEQSEVKVGFEDLPNGGDKDYNDLVFRYSGVTSALVPEPGTLALLALGVVPGAGLLVRRRRR